MMIMIGMRFPILAVLIFVRTLPFYRANRYSNGSDHNDWDDDEYSDRNDD